MGSDFELLPSDVAEEILAKVLAFRSGYQGREPGEDLPALLSIFPRVRAREGYVLDYVQETTGEGVALPIRPFARPADDDSWSPMIDTGVAPEREDLVDELYQYLEYDATPEGLFEYAFFAVEVGSVRASAHVSEWPESTPIFTAERFDQFVEAAGKVSDLKRPEHFGPQVRRDPEGGHVRFLVYTPMGWERIYYLESAIDGSGYVEQEAGDIVADMGSGMIF